MKMISKLLNILFLSIFTLLSFTSCNSDDDSDPTAIYSYTLETYTDMLISSNTEGATLATQLFIDNDWMMTKAISGSTREERDQSAQSLFEEVVLQANVELESIDFNGNTRLTYRCTRSNSEDSSEEEIGIQVWDFIE